MESSRGGAGAGREGLERKILNDMLFLGVKILREWRAAGAGREGVERKILNDMLFLRS